MADKNYKLNFEMSDGSTKSVEFTIPQGEKGEPGTPGTNGKNGTNGVGIVNISIQEV